MFVCRSSNIFDQMLSMMQKYADRLESLVDERTAQLQQEKRTTEALLLRMLPKYVTLSLTAPLRTQHRCMPVGEIWGYEDRPIRQQFGVM